MKKISNNNKNKIANVKFGISYSKLDKKGQIGETLTWIVATFLIIGILLIFIFASISLGKLKQINFNKASASTLKSPSNSGWVGLKNSLGFSLNDKNKEEIKDWLNEKDNS